MNPSPTLVDLASAASACARIVPTSLSDDELMDAQRSVAASTRLIEATAASLAAELGLRSSRDLGNAGLAQRRGARTPEALVQELTGLSGPAARRLVKVGTLVATASDPWLAPVTVAFTAGEVSSEAVDVVRAGLGAPTLFVTASDLTAAAASLVELAPTLSLERLAARAREFRDELDAAALDPSAVALREAGLRDRRSLRLYPQPDGMTRLIGLLDPESAAVVSGAIDAATSPRLGGPRFVDTSDATTASAIVEDPRTTEQLALDALVEHIDVAVRARVSLAPGARRADVRVLVTQRDLDNGSGVGFLDGQTAAISLDTVRRLACDGGVIPILFDDSGAALNLGRSQRLHSARQRIVIAARDGGCLAPNCDRPPSWCEVHHINEFGRGGSTSVDDGVLLCRHHHMLVHNNGWRVERTASTYWLIPPPDPGQQERSVRQRVELQTKSPAMRRLLVSA